MDDLKVSRTQYVPDKGLLTLEITFEKQTRSFIITGNTNLNDAKNLLQRLGISTSIKVCE